MRQVKPKIYDGYSYSNSGQVWLDGVGCIGSFATDSVLIARAKRPRTIYRPIMPDGTVLTFVTMRRQVGPALSSASKEPIA